MELMEFHGTNRCEKILDLRLLRIFVWISVSFAVVLSLNDNKTLASHEAADLTGVTNLSACAGFEQELRRFINTEVLREHDDRNHETLTFETDRASKDLCPVDQADPGMEGAGRARPLARCCTPEMEGRLMGRGALRLSSLVASDLNTRRQTLLTISTRLDNYCTQLIDISKRSLYDMFTLTYGQLFQQNSEIFIDLFRQLLSFYRGADVQLTVTVDSFFTQLMRRMFALLNAQYAFSDTYLSCVTEHMDVLRPFGDVPLKLSMQIRRAFTAARMFSQGLVVGREVLQDITKHNFTRSCSGEMARLLHCPYCSGQPNRMPCTGYCLTVLEACLKHHSPLERLWNTYIDEMLKVTSRLAGPFSIESVIEPIEVVISDAIMIYQENAESISNQVFQGCGQPEYSSPRTMSKRRADNRTSTLPGAQTSRAANRTSTLPGAQTSRASTRSRAIYSQLLHDGEQKLKSLSNLWGTLPESLCERVAAEAENESTCWNGHWGRTNDTEASSSRNSPAGAQSKVDGQARSSLMEATMALLNAVLVRLRRAHSGLSVDWTNSASIDEDLEEEEASGRGSGGQVDDHSSGSSPDRVSNPQTDISFSPNTAEKPPVVITRHQTGSNTCERRTLHIYLTCGLYTMMFIELLRYFNDAYWLVG